MIQSFPTKSAIQAFVGTYLLAGLAYVAIASDWPIFWPPMHVVSEPIDALASSGMAAVGLTLIAGLITVLFSPVLAFIGVRGLLVWWSTKRRDHVTGQNAKAGQADS